MNAKKIALVVLLLAVIAVAVVISVKRVRREIKLNPTPIADQKFPRIDIKTMQVYYETNSDWMAKYAPDASGRNKNPDTGEFTVVNTMTCSSCGQIIPVPQAPPGKASMTPADRPKKGGGGISPLLLNYICPKCGKKAYIPPPEKPAPKSGGRSEKSD